jgi:CDP-glycerol glycerophosphotransferase (TagB/SpsB family)
VGRFEYVLSSAVLRVVGALFGLLPLRRDRIVLATARVPILEGNLAHIHAAIVARHPDRQVVLLLEPYSYGFAGKVRYLVRLIRGMYHLRTAGLFVVDNAYLPVHVAGHRAGTTVVQVWHAVAALKRFGLDARTPPADPERRFLHRHYDYVVCTAERSRGPWSAAFGTPIDRVLPLGTPRTDVFADDAALAAARRHVLARHPLLRDRRVVLYAPTFRGRGVDKHAADGLDGRALRAALPADHVLVLKAHPNLDPSATDTAGFDVVVDPATEINDLLTATDVLITDYSSSIFEWALLRRPLVLLVPDLEAYEADPGLYLDYRTEMIGAQVLDTAGVAEAVLTATVDGPAWDAFIERHLGRDVGHASARFVERFVRPSGQALPGEPDDRSGTLPPDVRHE